MSDSDTDALAERAEGPSFPLLLRALAVFAVAALGWQAWRAIAAQPEDITVDRDVLLLAVLATAVVLTGLWHMLTARTAIDATHITQTGLWTRRLALSDVRRVEIVHLPFLAWVVAPRVRLRTATRGSYMFHATDPRVLARLWALALGGGMPPVERPTAADTSAPPSP